MLDFNIFELIYSLYFIFLVKIKRERYIYKVYINNKIFLFTFFSLFDIYIYTYINIFSDKINFKIKSSIKKKYNIYISFLSSLFFAFSFLKKKLYLFLLLNLYIRV